MKRDSRYNIIWVLGVCECVSICVFNVHILLERADLLSTEPVSRFSFKPVKKRKKNLNKVIALTMHFLCLIPCLCLFVIWNQKLSAYEKFFSGCLSLFLSHSLSPNNNTHCFIYFFFFIFVFFREGESVFASLLFHVSNITRLPLKVSRCIDWCSDTLMVESWTGIKKLVEVCNVLFEAKPLFDGI